MLFRSLGTESMTVIRRKQAVYERYLRSRQAEEDHPPRVLPRIVRTTRQSRLDHLRTTLATRYASGSVIDHGHAIDQLIPRP